MRGEPLLLAGLACAAACQSRAAATTTTEPRAAVSAERFASGKPLWVDSMPDEPLLNARVDVGTMHAVGDALEVDIRWPVTPGLINDLKETEGLVLPAGSVSSSRERVICRPDGMAFFSVREELRGPDGAVLQRREYDPAKRREQAEVGSYSPNPRSLACFAAARKCARQMWSWPPPPNLAPLDGSERAALMRAEYAKLFGPLCAIPPLAGSAGAVGDGKACFDGDAKACFGIGTAVANQRPFGNLDELRADCKQTKRKERCSASFVEQVKTGCRSGKHDEDCRLLGASESLRLAEATAPIKTLEASCKKNEQQACIDLAVRLLGQRMLEGGPSDEDEKRALGLLDRSCKAGAADGCTRLGMFIISWGKPSDMRGFTSLKRACELGSKPACSSGSEYLAMPPIWWKPGDRSTGPAKKQ
jgi:hypothetical protein